MKKVSLRVLFIGILFGMITIYFNQSHFTDVLKKHFITSKNKQIPEFEYTYNPHSHYFRNNQINQGIKLRAAFLSIDLSNLNTIDDKNIELLIESLTGDDLQASNQASLMTRSLLIQCGHHQQFSCESHRSLYALFNRFRLQQPELIAEFRLYNPQSPVLTFLGKLN